VFGRRHLQVRKAERANEEAQARYNEDGGEGQRRAVRISQTHDRDDPRLLHRRRPRASQCCCDLRIRIRQFAFSRFRPPSSGWATPFPGIKRLSDLVGPSFTKEIFYTGRASSTPPRALAMGLVNRVLPADGVETYVKDYAETHRRQTRRSP